jgi:hypothetical protein
MNLNEIESYRHIGSGHFSRVYKHPSDPKKCIKVGPLNDGWLIYASYVGVLSKTHPSIHLPVIHNIERHEEDGKYIAVMERLDMTALAEKSKALPGFPNWDLVGNAYNSGQISFLEENPIVKALKERDMSMEDIEKFIFILKKIYTFGVDNDIEQDLHDENAMIRIDENGNHVLVITDPYSYNRKKIKFEECRER